MKLTDADIMDEDFLTINRREDFSRTIGYEDVRLSQDVPLVVRYDYIDMGKTDYHFGQQFTHEDTKGYFERMRNFAGKSINELLGHSKDCHFYRSELKGKVAEAVRKILPDAVNSNQIVYHFGLYDSNEWADREKDIRNPRVYFMLGTYGHIYILFFDPYHELNPMVSVAQNA